MGGDRRCSMTATIVILLVISWFWTHENNMTYQVVRQLNRIYDFRISEMISRVKTCENYSDDKKSCS